MFYFISFADAPFFKKYMWLRQHRLLIKTTFIFFSVLSSQKWLLSFSLMFSAFCLPLPAFLFACTRTSLELGLCYRHGGATWRNKLALPAGQGNPHQDLLTDRLHKLGHELTT